MLLYRGQDSKRMYYIWMQVLRHRYYYLFMLISTAHEISTSHKNKMLKIIESDFTRFLILRCCIYPADKC